MLMGVAGGGGAHAGGAERGSGKGAEVEGLDWGVCVECGLMES